MGHELCITFLFYLLYDKQKIYKRARVLFQAEIIINFTIIAISPAHADHFDIQAVHLCFPTCKRLPTNVAFTVQNKV